MASCSLAGRLPSSVVDRCHPRRMPTLTPDEAAPARRLLAGRQLPLGGPDLPARQPAAATSRCSPEHIKPRLLGHWGTTPGLNFIYAHMNRVIRNWDLDAIYVIGPGHGGPGPRRQRLPRGHLQRGLSRHHARRGRACAGCSASSPSRAASPVTSRPRRPARSTRAASSATRSRTPSGRPSTTPTWSSAASSATARRRPARWPRAGTRTSSCRPSRDGAVLPILHLNGYKIANPTVLARIPRT